MPTSGSSPFPEIDEFVRDLVSEDSGYIRKWLLAGKPITSLVSHLQVFLLIAVHSGSQMLTSVSYPTGRHPVTGRGLSTKLLLII